MKDSNTLPCQLTRHRQQLIDRLWQWLAALALIAVPASILRFMYTGWLPLYNAHIGIGGIGIMIYLFRNHISYTWKIWFMVLIFWLIGFAGLITQGVLSSGVWWMVMAAMLLITLHSKRAGIATLALTTLVSVIIGLCFVTGKLVVPFDANVYITSINSWITLLIATSLMPFIMLENFSTFQQTILDLLKEVHQQHDEIKHLATHDHLTGIPSLNLLHDRLEMAINRASRSQHKIALLYIDLDGFKVVNDTFGHHAGDSVLKIIAKRLIESIRKEDTVARIGGDEFVVLLNAITDIQAVAGIAEKLINEISRPVVSLDHSCTVGASIGIGLYPDDASDAHTLLQISDQTMYRVKRTGKNNYLFVGDSTHN